MDNNINDLIDEDFLKKLVQEVLKEMTSTGGVACPATKFAFSGTGDSAKKKKIAKRSVPGGTVVGEEAYQEPNDATDSNSLPIVRKGIHENRYRNFKTNSNMKEHAKISFALREAKKILKEVNFLVNISERLKTELNVDSGMYWKRTSSDLMEIATVMKEINKKINRLK